MKLEDRYIVIKLSKLDDSQKNELRSCLMDFVPKDSLVQCAIVEKDWPMYKATVASILEFAEEEKKRLAFVSCSYCDGKGYIVTGSGHDCWGKNETYSETCPVCQGTREHDEKRYSLVIQRDAIEAQL